MKENITRSFKQKAGQNLIAELMRDVQGHQENEQDILKNV